MNDYNHLKIPAVVTIGLSEQMNMPTLNTVHQDIRVFQIRSLIEGKNKTQDPRDS